MMTKKEIDQASKVVNLLDKAWLESYELKRMSATNITSPSSINVALEAAHADLEKRIAEFLNQKKGRRITMVRAITLLEYFRLAKIRQEIISINRSRRMQKNPVPPLPVPERPERPLVPIAYDPEGNYIGRLKSADELSDLPNGSILKWEEAIY